MRTCMCIRFTKEGLALGKDTSTSGSPGWRLTKHPVTSARSPLPGPLRAPSLQTDAPSLPRSCGVPQPGPWSPRSLQCWFGARDTERLCAPGASARHASETSTARTVRTSQGVLYGSLRVHRLFHSGSDPKEAGALGPGKN